MGWLKRPVPAWLLLVVIIGAVLSTASALFIPSLLSPKPDFTLRAIMDPMTVLALGGKNSTIVRISPVNNFTGIISLKASAPVGVSTRIWSVDLSGSPISVIDNVLLGTYQNVSLEVTAADAGNFPLVITGTSGRLSHSITLTTVSRGLAFSANPNPVIVHPGSSANSVITITSKNGLSGNFTTHYSLDYYQTHMVVSGVPSSILLAADGKAMFTVTFTADSAFTGGVFFLTFFTAPPQLQSVGFSLSITAG